MLTETEKAYLAGFFDGDGCVNIGTRQGKSHATVSYYLQVVFSQCDRPFLERWSIKVGMGSVYENAPLRHPTIKQTKTLWHWRLMDRQAEAMLRMMLPYLDIKKDQAEIAIRFMRTKGTGGPRPTSRGILSLREQYSQMLKDAKREHPEQQGPHEKPAISPEIEEYESSLDSQLCLFDIANN